MSKNVSVLQLVPGALVAPVSSDCMAGPASDAPVVRWTLAQRGALTRVRQGGCNCTHVPVESGPRGEELSRFWHPACRMHAARR